MVVRVCRGVHKALAPSLAQLAFPVASLFPHFFVSKIDGLASLKSEIVQILAISKALESGQFIMADNHCGFCLHPGPHGFFVMEWEFPFALADCICSYSPTIPEHCGVSGNSGIWSLVGERAAST